MPKKGVKKYIKPIKMSCKIKNLQKSAVLSKKLVDKNQFIL